MKHLKSVLLFYLFLQTNGFLLLSGKNFGELDKKKREGVIPEKCKKENFMKNYIDTKTALEIETLEDLVKCSEYYPNCSYPGDISATYEESKEGKLFISLKFAASMQKPKSDCWGYLIEVSEGKTTTQLFVPANIEETYEADIYIKLAFEYEFVVTSLPSDKSLVMSTTAPTRCQFEVIDDIYYKIQKAKVCHKAKLLPSYEERYQIAKQICNIYPKNSGERWDVISEKVLIDENCKLKMPSLKTKSMIN